MAENKPTPADLSREELVKIATEKLGSNRAAEDVVDALIMAGATQPQVKYELAYEAAATLLTQQDGALGNLRTRATSVFSIATLVAALASTAGLVTKAPVYPIGIDIGLLAAIALIGLCTLVIVWPVKVWHWGPSAPDLLRFSGGADQARMAATRSMNTACASNNSVLHSRMLWFQAGVIGLGLETALVVAAVIAYR